MRHATRTASALLLLAMACSGRAGEPSTVRVTLTDGTARAAIAAEVAATPEARSRGFMFRDRIPAGTGMLFVFPAPHRGAFFMKNTRVPLTIFFIGDGRVLEVRDMEPCRADPCPLTTPGRDYLWALEVHRGSAPGIGVGALVAVEGRLPEAT